MLWQESGVDDGIVMARERWRNGIFRRRVDTLALVLSYTAILIEFILDSGALTHAIPTITSVGRLWTLDV